MARRKDRFENGEYYQEPQGRGPRVRTFYGNVSQGITPCAKASDFIQLPPTVMPITIVPYATQDQPLYTLDDEDLY